MDKRPQDITTAERDIRVKMVEQLILQGASRGEIIQYCSEKYNTVDRTIDNYITEAKDLIKENFAKMYDKEYFKANVFRRLEDLYKQNYDVEDFRECRNLLKDLRDMFGLNEPSKTDITSNGKDVGTGMMTFFKTDDDKDQ